MRSHDLSKWSAHPDDGRIRQLAEVAFHLRPPPFQLPELALTALIQHCRVPIQFKRNLPTATPYHVRHIRRL